MLNRLLAAAFLVAPLALGAVPSPITPDFSLLESHGFCPGTAPGWGWPTPKPPGLRLWTTFCSSQSADAIAVSNSFSAPAHLTLYLLGWMTPGHQRLALENLETRRQLAITFVEIPGGEWTRLTFSVPDSWRGKQVRLLVSTPGTLGQNLVGFSEPFSAAPSGDYLATALMFLRLLEYFLLLSLPFFAAGTIALVKGIRHPSLVVFFGLAGAGLAGYAAFWSWYLVPRSGHLFSFLLPFACLGVVVYGRRILDPSRRRELRAAIAPWLLVFSFGLFVTASGFLFGGIDDSLNTPKTRFSHQLPYDNELQYIFSEQIIGHKVLHPMTGGWLSSDRPPLETGFTLLQIPFVIPPHSLAYTLLSILLQCFWAPALWGFLYAFGVRGKLIGWTLAACLFSGFTLVNTFFVWPKLMAAAYMIAFSAVLLAPELFQELRSRPSVAVLSGALLAFGMLSHGGSAFAFLGVIPVLLLVRHSLPWRRFAFTAAALFALYLPWTAYQKFVDPPGDRLIKWHLAGHIEPTNEPLLKVFRDAYHNASWAQIIHARTSNLRMIVGPQKEYWEKLGRFVIQAPLDVWRSPRRAGPLATDLRVTEFFHLVPALGVFMLGPFALLFGFAHRFRTREWRVAGLCWLLVACTLAIWCGTMFLPDAAMPHQGTFLANLLAVAGSVLAFWAISPALAGVLTALHILVGLLLYLIYPRLSTAPGALIEGMVHRGELILLILAVPVLSFSFIILSRRASKVLPLGDPVCCKEGL